MRVSDIMTGSVDSIRSTDSIAYAARQMAEVDVGALPILSDGKLVGIVTDRDIAVRGVANGITGGSSIRRVMTEHVETCTPRDDVATALALMSREKIRRMPVCNADDEVIGIVTLSDAAQHAPDRTDVAATLADISAPHGQHCQAALGA